MKTSHLFNIILAIALVVVSMELVISKTGKSDKEEVATTEQTDSASSNDELKPFDFKKELTGNPFYFIDHFHPSGRDGDKGKALGLHTAYTPHGTPYYTEATEVYECEIMYAHQFSRDGFRNDVPKNLYADFPPGIHSMYIGEVIAAWRK